MDGASRGNPGEAGFGIHVTAPDGSEVASLYGYLGQATNNVAEYQALLHGLRFALARGASRVEVFSDSELLVRQLEGRYRVKNAGPPVPLHREAQVLLARFERARVAHVPRERNREADALANRAVDERASNLGPAQSVAEQRLRGGLRGGTLQNKNARRSRRRSLQRRRARLQGRSAPLSTKSPGPSPLLAYVARNPTKLIIRPAAAPVAAVGVVEVGAAAGAVGEVVDRLRAQAGLEELAHVGGAHVEVGPPVRPRPEERARPSGPKAARSSSPTS